MAVYFEFGNGEQIQVATNRGWGDVRRAMQGSDSEDLFENGEVESIDGLAEQFQKVATNDQNVKHTIAGIVDTLSTHDDQTDSLVVTDGMGPDEDDETDDDIDDEDIDDA